MKTRQWLYFAAFVAVIACVSCNKNKMEQTKHIPSDANVVVGVRMESLYNKLKDRKDLLDSATQFFSDRIADITGAADTDKQAAAAFIKSVDTRQPIFLFYQKKSSIAEGAETLTGIVIALSNADNFADYVKTNLSEVVSQGNGYSFGLIKNATNGLVGWNRNLAIFIAYAGDASAAPAQLEALFNLKESQSLADNSSFNTSYDAQADMSFYINSSQAFVAAPFLAITKASDLVKDTYTTGAINFNDGVIDISSSHHPNDAMQDIVRKNPSAPLDGKILSAFPNKLQGFVDFSINPKQLISIIQYMGLDQLIASSLKNQGLTLNDIAAVFKGEIVAGMSNFSNDHNNFLICFPIADKATYDRVLNALVKNNPNMWVNKNGQYVPFFFSNNSAAYRADNNNLMIASTQGMIDSFVTGKKASAQPDEVSNLKGKTAYLYGDLQSIFSGTAPFANRGEDSERIAIAAKTLKDFSAWGNSVSGKVYTGEAHIHFVDTKQNSLVSLLTMINEWKKVQEKYNLINGILLKNPPPIDTNDLKK